MTATRLDHVILAAGPDGLTATAERVAATLGAVARPGGVHTTYGTRNAIVPLGTGYLEVVAVEDAAVAAGSPFGSVVAARCAAGGGWVGWAVAVDDPAEVAGRLGAQPVPGGRERPDGVRLRWEQVGVETLTTDPSLPFFLWWDVPADLHPAAGGPAGVEVVEVVLGGPDVAARLASWLDGAPPVAVAEQPDAPAGLHAVVLRTAEGRKTLWS